MLSVLNKGSAVYTSQHRSVVYDLDTQQGRSDFWNFILAILGGTTNSPGLVTSPWKADDSVTVVVNGYNRLITGTGQIWIHGAVAANLPFTWNAMSLTVIDPASDYILFLRLNYSGASIIEMLARTR